LTQSGASTDAVSSEDSEQQSARRPLLAFVLTLLVTGLGQIYNRDFRRAFMFLGSIYIAIVLAALACQPILLILVPATKMVSLLDAPIRARQVNNSGKAKSNRWFIYALYLLGTTALVWIVGRPIHAYKIPSGAMEPTLLIGDHIEANRLAYFGRDVQRGDVVVFKYPEDPTKDFIKRVVAIPGDTVEVKQGQLYLNGARIDAPYARFEVPQGERSNSPRDSLDPTRIQPGQYFMMGDNRDRSYDSRFWGTASRDAIEGRAMFIYWSCGGEDASWLRCFYDVRWSRLFHVVR
jgi:signal peptidase I